MLSKYRSFRQHTQGNAVTPIGLIEYSIGRVIGRLIVTSVRMAKRRGDFHSVNASRLALWAGNQRGANQEVHDRKPHEITRALREQRLRIIIEEPAEKDSPRSAHMKDAGIAP